MIRIFRHYIYAPYLCLLITEWFVFVIALYLGSIVRFLYTASWYSTEQMLLTSCVFATVFTISCSAFGLYSRTLYSRTMLQEGHMLADLIYFSCMLAIFLLAFGHYIFPQYFLASSVMLYAVLFAFVGLRTVRSLFYRLVNLENLKRRILVIGCGERASQLQVINSRYMHRGFVIVGHACLENEISMVSDPIIIEADGEALLFSGYRRLCLAWNYGMVPYIWLVSMGAKQCNCF